MPGTERCQIELLGTYNINPRFPAARNLPKTYKINVKYSAIQEEHSERELQITMWYLQVCSARCIQKPVKHLRRSFFTKKPNQYKLLANYICKKAPCWMFDKDLNTSMKFIQFIQFILYVMVVSKNQQLHKSNDEYCLCNVTWSGDINQKPSISLEIIFR